MAHGFAEFGAGYRYIMYFEMKRGYRLIGNTGLGRSLPDVPYHHLADGTVNVWQGLDGRNQRYKHHQVSQIFGVNLP